MECLPANLAMPLGGLIPLGAGLLGAGALTLAGKVILDWNLTGGIIEGCV